MRQRRLWTWLSYVLGILIVIAWAIATNAIWVVDWLERLNPPGVRTTPGLAEHIGRIYGDSRDAYGQPRVHRAVRSDSVRVPRTRSSQ